jgi:hypothetical protein
MSNRQASRRFLVCVGAVVILGWSALGRGQTPLREFHVDRSVVDVDNEFNRRDPFYKQRAGAFYEYRYVAPSAEALIRIADIRAEQMPGTLDALRAFVYEWLDAFVRGNGSISRSELEQTIARMDERFDLLLDSPLQRKLYRVWRDDDSNRLGFLMMLTQTTRAAVSPPRPPACADMTTVVGGATVTEHVPYPPPGRPWPVGIATAAITKDSHVAHPWTDSFRDTSIDEVRLALTQYLVVHKAEWEHSYSHVAGHDEGGWVVAGNRCFSWRLRPGGLAWITYPDGTAVYLAASCRASVGSACSSRQ